MKWIETEAIKGQNERSLSPKDQNNNGAEGKESIE